MTMDSFGGSGGPSGPVGVPFAIPTLPPMPPTRAIAGPTWQTFPPIAPSPVRDYRYVDFSADTSPPPGTQPGAPYPTIAEAKWTATVDPLSPTIDRTPMDRLLSTQFDITATAQLIGDCIDGCIYLFDIQVSLTDGSILVKHASMACSSVIDQPPVHVTPPLRPGEIPFIYYGWVAQYPEFTGMPKQQAQGYWDNACLMFRNDYSSPQQNLAARQDILWLLTAHCAALFAPAPYGRGGIGSTVGVITSKSVDGVSLGSSGMFPGVSGSQAWYLQTQYGAKAWLLMAPYRTFHYIQGPQRYPYPPNINYPPYSVGTGYPFNAYNPWRGY